MDRLRDWSCCCDSRFRSGCNCGQIWKKGGKYLDEGLEFINEEYETFYRTVSDLEWERIQEVGGIVPRKADYFVTQNYKYVEHLMETAKFKKKKEYRKIIELTVPKGTKKALENVGARAKGQPQLLEYFGHLPEYHSDMIEKVHLKWEKGSLNYGLSPETRQLFEILNMKVIKTK